MTGSLGTWLIPIAVLHAPQCKAVSRPRGRPHDAADLAVAGEMAWPSAALAHWRRSETFELMNFLGLWELTQRIRKEC